MDLNNIINNVIEYKYLSTKKDLVHIGYGIDNNYVRCADNIDGLILFK